MIRNASRLAATSVALFLLASPTFAQQAPQPSASQLAAATDVAVSSGLTGAFDAMTDPLLNQLQQMNVTRPEIRQDLDQVVTLIRPEVEQKKKEMIDATARTLAARLSEAELKEITAFYKSPVGQKWVQLQPGILDAIVRDMAIWTQKTSEFIMSRAREEMGKRGHQLN